MAQAEPGFNEGQGMGVPSVKAAFFDVDGTLTRGGPVWDPLLTSPDVRITQRAWLYGTAMPHYILSKVRLVSQAGFRDRWVRLMAWLMTGWPVDRVDEVCSRIMHDMLIPDLRPDIVEVLNQHRQAGHVVLLVSTMPDLIVQRLAQHLQASAGIGSAIAITRGRATGSIAGATCAGPRKVEFIERYLAEHVPGLTLKDCAAYADSRSDLPLLEAVGYPIAVYPDEAMHAAAVRAGWPVLIGPE